MAASSFILIKILRISRASLWKEHSWFDLNWMAENSVWSHDERMSHREKPSSIIPCPIFWTGRAGAMFVNWECDFFHSALNARRGYRMRCFARHAHSALILQANSFMGSHHRNAFIGVALCSDEGEEQPWNGALHSAKWITRATSRK
jgi:hypothetical protein